MDNFFKQVSQTVNKRKFLNETFDYLYDLEAPKKFIALSDFPPINKIEFFIQKTKHSFSFKTQSLNLVKNFATYRKEGYGFFKPLKLQRDNIIWINPKGVATMDMELGDAMTTCGEIWLVESSFSVSEKKYFRLVLPKEYNPNKDHHCFIQNERFAVDDSLNFAGLTEFYCNQNLFHLFDYSNDKKFYLFIDSLTPMLYEEFEKSIGAIIYSLGFITGYLPRDEMYILQSDDSNFKKISGFQFRKTEDTVLSAMEIVSPQLFSEFAKVKHENVQVSLEVFSNLTTKARKDSRFLRALKIISEGNEYPLEIRASAYSVALETIKNIIIEENEEKTNPFKEKKFAQKIIKSLKQIITPIENIHFNNKESVLNKLEQLNQLTNKDSFKIAFALCGFKLTANDEEALLKRNDFLHGRIPFEHETEEIQNQELNFITYKLHFLVTALIMKYVKFSGLLKNNPKFFSVFADGNKEIDEPLFRRV